jgi:pimeloyl-ACP methyl ester carboxylesterase
VVGFSAGGFITVEIANKYPELVKSLSISGVYNMASRRRLLAVAPYLAVPVQSLQCALPLSVSSYISGTESHFALLEDIKRNNRFKLAKEGYRALLEMGEDYPLEVRTLAVAGTKHDDVEGTRNLGLILRKSNPQSRAVKIEGGTHGWSIQWPELFADASLGGLKTPTCLRNWSLFNKQQAKKCYAMSYQPH